MFSVDPSAKVLSTAVLLTVLLIVTESGIEAHPVLNHENELRSKFNSINCDSSVHKFNANQSKSSANLGKHTCDESDDTIGERYGGNRIKRQLDFNIDADHEEGAGTDIVASATAVLYKSVDGDTRLDGTARYSQHFSDYSGNGKAKFGGSLHFSHRHFTVM